MSANNTQPARKSNIEAIVNYFKSGIKNECEAIGIELEHTLVKSDGTPVSYSDDFGQKAILEQMFDEYEEKIFSSAGHLIGLVRDGESVTLEPGAQFEISAGPFRDLHIAKKQFLDFESRLQEAVSGHNIEVLTPGYHPTRKAIELELLPKRRYEIMNEYLGAISMYGICMMRGSASTQVAIDYTSVDDCLRKMKLAFACVPILSLICDNSPIFEAQVRPHLMMRTEIWNKCDPDRCTLVPGIMDEDFTLEAYAEYILDTPALDIVIDGRDELSTKTFGEIYSENTMTETEVEHALSMFFTDVRLKRYIEIRPADAMPVDVAIAYAALIKGLFYSEASLNSLESLFENVDAQDIVAAKSALMKDGYAAQVYAHAASTIADELISIASTGLSDVERGLLAPLANLVSNRTTLADIALEELQ